MKTLITTVFALALFVLLAIGILTMRANKHKDYFLFSTIPLFFSAQQFVEGVNWLSLQKKARANDIL